MILNLGCPYYHAGQICVDLYPQSDEVVRDDAIHFLQKQPKDSIDTITSTNMLEHLPNVGLYFIACNYALKKGGHLLTITDNAEWLPYYVPYFNRLGWGAHSSDICCPPGLNSTRHYCIFTKRHLTNFATLNGFLVRDLHRTMFGARLFADMEKIVNAF